VKQRRDLAIPFSVAGQFFHPPLGSDGPKGCTQRLRSVFDQHTRVPEIAVYENDKSLACKGDVGFSWKITTTNAVTEALSPENTSE
jgi:hypothetical protein